MAQHNSIFERLSATELSPGRFFRYIVVLFALFVVFFSCYQYRLHISSQRIQTSIYRQMVQDRLEGQASLDVNKDGDKLVNDLASRHPHAMSDFWHHRIDNYLVSCANRKCVIYRSGGLRLTYAQDARPQTCGIVFDAISRLGASQNKATLVGKDCLDTRAIGVFEKLRNGQGAVYIGSTSGLFDVFVAAIYDALVVLLFLLAALYVFWKGLHPTHPFKFIVSRENAPLNQSLFYANPTVQLLVNPDSGRIVAANDAAAAFYMYDTEELCSKSVFDLNTLPKNIVKKRITEVLKHQSGQFSFVHILGNGEEREVEVNSRVVEVGKRTLLFSVIRDTSETIRTERALRSSEQRYRELIRNMPVCSVIVSGDVMGGFVITDLNPAAERFEDVSAPTIIGQPLDVLYGKNLSMTILPVVYRVLETGHPDSYTEVRKNAGGVVTRWCTYEIFRLPGGELVILYNDQTSQKNTEITLRKNTTKLAKRIKEVNCLYALSRYIEDARISSHELFRVSVEAIPLAWEYPDITCAQLDVSGHVYKTDNYRETPWKLERSLVVSGQKIGHISVGYLEERPVRDEGPFLLQERELLDEIGRRLENYISSNQSVEKLRYAAKMEAVGTLAGGIAHDFNNILTGIMGHCFVATEKLSKNNTVQNNLTQVMTAAERAKNLVEQLLGFSRQGKAEQEHVNIAKIVAEACELVKVSCPANVHLSQTGDAEPPAVWADGGQLHQVFVNVLQNALFATEKEGDRVVVDVSTTQISLKTQKTGDLLPGRYICVKVTDNGSGIDEYTLERVFDPFFSTKEVGQGTGLGLSMALGIVQDHGGDIVLDSELGKGTVVKIFLPVDLAHETEKPLKTAEIADSPDVSFANLLLLDDGGMVIKTYYAFLQSYGYAVRLAENLSEASKQLQDRQNKTDLLIMAVKSNSDTPVQQWVDDIRKLAKDNASLSILLVTDQTELLAREFSRFKRIDVVSSTIQPALVQRKIRQFLNNA